MIKYLNSKNIFPQFHYKPLTSLNSLKKKKIKNFSGANSYYLNNISLPIYVNMRKSEVLKIIKYIKVFINKNYHLLGSIIFKLLLFKFQS